LKSAVSGVNKKLLNMNIAAVAKPNLARSSIGNVLRTIHNVMKSNNLEPIDSKALKLSTRVRFID